MEIKKKSFKDSIRASLYSILALGIAFVLYIVISLITSCETVSAQAPIVEPPIVGDAHRGEFDPNLFDDFELRGTITIRNTGDKDIYPPFPIPMNTSSFSQMSLLGNKYIYDEDPEYNMAGYLMGYAEYFGYRHISICKSPPLEYAGEICGTYADERGASSNDKYNEYGRLFYNVVAFDLDEDINEIGIVKYSKETDKYACSSNSADNIVISGTKVTGDRTLFKDSIGDDDAVYFAFKHTPFRVLWLDLDVAGNRVGGPYELEWQYYDQASSAYIPIEDVVDETKSFHREGQGTVNWDLSILSKMGTTEVGDSNKGCQLTGGPFYVVRAFVKKQGSGTLTMPEVSVAAADVGIWWLGMPGPYYPCRKSGNSPARELEYCYPFRFFGTDSSNPTAPYPVKDLDIRLSNPYPGYAGVSPDNKGPQETPDPTPVPSVFVPSGVPSGPPDIFFHMNNGEPAKISSGEERVYNIYIKNVCDQSYTNNYNIKSFIQWGRARTCIVPSSSPGSDREAKWNTYVKELQFVMNVATPKMLSLSAHVNAGQYNRANVFSPNKNGIDLPPKPFDFKFNHLYKDLEGYESIISPFEGPTNNVTVVERQDDIFDVVITNLDISGLHFGQEYDEAFFDIGSVDTQQFIIGRKFIADISERTGIPVRFFWSIIAAVLTIMVIIGVQYFIGNQTMSVIAGAVVQVIVSLPTMGISSMIYVVSYVCMSAAVIVVRNRN